jgi:hypothetical protein
MHAHTPARLHSRSGGFVAVAQAACTLFATHHLDATVNAVGLEFRRLLLGSSEDHSGAGGSGGGGAPVLRVAPPCTNADGPPFLRFVAPLDTVLPPDLGRGGRGDAEVSCGLPIMGELAAR